MSCVDGKVVCVTGASGFIASWLVKLLLQRGYTVKATVRDPNDQKKTEHLLSLEGAKERLHLFKADLLEEGSFDSVIEGCECVFHTASPVIISVTDPQAQLIDPALKGTLNVLESCAKFSSIKRVIITSSMAAVANNEKPIAADVTIDESWYSDPAFCEKSQRWYPLSKTLAEEAAWKFSKEKGIDIITMNPAWVIGPLLQPTLNLSVELVLKLVNDNHFGKRKDHDDLYTDISAEKGFGSQVEGSMQGLKPAKKLPDNRLIDAGTETFPNTTHRFVDVRDVANAHILAFENPSASGRYCLVGSVHHCSEIVKMLRSIFPALNLPDKCADDKPFTPTCQVSKERAQTLGVKFTPLEVTLKDTVESLKDKNFF